MLSGNNYTMLHVMPPLVDDAKKYAVILPDVVIICEKLPRTTMGEKKKPSL